MGRQQHMRGVLAETRRAVCHAKRFREVHRTPEDFDRAVNAFRACLPGGAELVFQQRRRAVFDLPQGTLRLDLRGYPPKVILTQGGVTIPKDELQRLVALAGVDQIHQVHVDPNPALSALVAAAIRHLDGRQSRPTRITLLSRREALLTRWVGGAPALLAVMLGTSPELFASPTLLRAEQLVMLGEALGASQVGFMTDGVPPELRLEAEAEGLMLDVEPIRVRLSRRLDRSLDCFEGGERQVARMRRRRQAELEKQASTLYGSEELIVGFSRSDVLRIEIGGRPRRLCARVESLPHWDDPTRQRAVWSLAERLYTPPSYSSPADPLWPVVITDAGVLLETGSLRAYFPVDAQGRVGRAAAEIPLADSWVKKLESAVEASGASGVDLTFSSQSSGPRGFPTDREIWAEHCADRVRVDLLVRGYRREQDRWIRDGVDRSAKEGESGLWTARADAARDLDAAAWAAGATEVTCWVRPEGVIQLFARLPGGSKVGAVFSCTGDGSILLRPTTLRMQEAHGFEAEAALAKLEEIARVAPGHRLHPALWR